jgi:hypothetical protein
MEHTETLIEPFVFDEMPPAAWGEIAGQLSEIKGGKSSASPEKVRRELEKLFCSHFEVRRPRGSREYRSFEKGFDNVPLQDHNAYWISVRNSKRVMTSEPYGYLTSERFAEAHRLCAEHARKYGWRYRISREWAFWNPGNTILIWWERL